jgi:hypothetical protein
MARLVAAVLVTALTISSSPPVSAKPRAGDPIVDEARRHYELGAALYKASRFAEALREFEAGYALTPRPLFLVNIAQAHRHLGQLEEAAAAFEKFLAVAPPDDPDRGQAKETLALIRRELAARPPAEPARPVVAPAPPAASPTVAPAPPRAMAPVAVVDRAAPVERRSFARRHWWIFPTVVVVAAGIAVGLGVGLTRGGPCDGMATCLDLGHR